MKKEYRFWFVTLIIATLISFATIDSMAQDGVADAPAGQAQQKDSGGGFAGVVFGGTLVDKFIWLMIFSTSLGTLWLIIDGIKDVKREKMLPEDLVEGIRMSLDEGDLDAAIQTCEVNPGSLSNILMSGFNNISEGFEVIQDSITAATDLETEKIMQKINYLNLCGQIAPMLGLLGTVVGMVSAFAGLASASGAAKAAVLAKSISGALWTTCVGLLISVPALVGFAIIKNYATRLLLETEATVIDLVKILRDAEVEEEE
ncbi:MAG: MotA/TolQ/ExbB proton channel family protein [Verrucomicrobiota bacterium]|nr:MotA/TolQ/ExbB proton channel family protein [Verrucomicrobiota bacterium]